HRGGSQRESPDPAHGQPPSSLPTMWRAPEAVAARSDCAPELTPSADRLRLEGRRDKSDHAHHQEDPQKYNGKNGDGSDYRKECFHHVPRAAAKRLSISRAK